MTNCARTPIWNETGTRTELPPLSGSHRADACVIGLGGSGLTAIETLRQAGLRVIGLDRLGIAAGAAGRNGGFLLAGVADFHHRARDRLGSLRAAALYRATHDELSSWFAQPDTTARQCGSLRIAADEAELADCERQAETLRTDGFKVERYQGIQGQGLLFPGDGVFQPMRHWHELGARLQRAGASLYGGSSVLFLEQGRAVTAHGEVRAPHILVCVDGGLERLLPSLAGRVRSARLQMLATAPLPMTAQRPVYFRDGHDYWQQLDDGCVALGGGRDRGGEVEWGAPAVPSQSVQDHLDALLQRQFGAEALVTHRWAAEVAYSEAGLPIFGECAAGIFVTGAYSGTGNVLGALCGRALAMQALGQSSEVAELLAGRNIRI